MTYPGLNQAASYIPHSFGNLEGQVIDYEPLVQPYHRHPYQGKAYE